MPSPAPEHPGLFIRDPYKFSEAMLVIPPPLVGCLDCFDGEHTELDLTAELVRITGDLDVADLRQQLLGALDSAGFLENETFAIMEAERRAEFAGLAVREPAHAGSAYPEDIGELRQTMNRYLPDGAAQGAKVRGIAAPHVSPEGGWQSYQAAFQRLGPEDRDRTFVILATSHYGEPQKFGLTRKPYRTPFGDAHTDEGMVKWLAERAPKSVLMEDYCHSFEHTAEFQVLFLQQMLGPTVKILPVLCGSFAQSLYRGGMPEDDDGVKSFFEALGELGEREGDKICWVLGVDMAHMGARYQDDFDAVAQEGRMAAVAARDQRRIESINAGDADGFWAQVKENHDDLKWCGSAPFYTFLKVAPKLRGELLRYEQWNIDARSVVSFAGMAFQ